MKKIFLSLSALVLSTLPTFAQVECAPHKDVTASLLRNFQETVQSTGIAANGSFVETYANLSSTTWTIVIVTPDGNACLVASGDNFELLGENS